MKTLEDIKNSEVYKQVMGDSFGGIMYNVANYGKYNATEILQAWDKLTASEKESAGGLVKGAINFLQGK